MPGMRTSSSTMSGCCASQISSARRPFSASAVTSKPSISFSIERNRSRAGGSSSTTSTLRFMACSSCAARLARLERKAQRHDVLIVETPGLDGGALAVHEVEALADVGQRQPVAVAHGEVGGGQRVAHDNRDHALVEL